MTAPERARLKVLVDAARRVALGPVCAHCAAEFVPVQRTQRYCGSACKRSAWYRTDKGKAWRLAKDRARRAAA